jgi:hypothetical protein
MRPEGRQFDMPDLMPKIQERVGFEQWSSPLKINFFNKPYVDISIIKIMTLNGL